MSDLLTQDEYQAIAKQLDFPTRSEVGDRRPEIGKRGSLGEGKVE